MIVREGVEIHPGRHEVTVNGETTGFAYTADLSEAGLRAAAEAAGAVAARGGATERTIALLKERRASLIAAAVTGQIEVGTAA